MVTIPNKKMFRRKMTFTFFIAKIIVLQQKVFKQFYWNGYYPFILLTIIETFLHLFSFMELEIKQKVRNDSFNA